LVGPGGLDLPGDGRQIGHALTRQFASRASVVSIHTPLTAETRGLIGAEAVAAAKRGVILINTERGTMVDIDALYDAMKDGSVLAAGLDVQPEEPANAQRRLMRLS
jgi:phosphoglycerate dehydrogenase-like enzyme